MAHSQNSSKPQKVYSPTHLVSITDESWLRGFYPDISIERRTGPAMSDWSHPGKTNAVIARVRRLWSTYL